jgi:threonine dehydrogenase-like Zn-dependent dehydrogenase
MRVAVMTAPGEVQVEDRADPTILKPTDAIIRLSASCICGSDLWPYRGIETLTGPRPMGHEYAGIVEEVGSAVSTIKPGQFVVGSFLASDNTCQICPSGYQPSCPHKEAFGPTGAAQAERMRGQLVPAGTDHDDVAGLDVSDANAAQASLEVLYGDAVAGPKGLLPARGSDEVRGPTLSCLMDKIS